MKWIFSLAAFAFFFTPLTNAQTNNDDLITSVDAALLQRLIASVGDDITQTTEINGAPAVIVKDPDTGLIYQVAGTACNGDRCSGIEMSARWGATAANSDLEMLNRLSLTKAAVKVALQTNSDGSESVLVSRYLVLDFGQMYQNLELNVSIFVAIASGLGESF
ncbi:MAG: hypothetical protein AAGK66_08680 [Pseudomonadota bacterium]